MGKTIIVVLIVIALVLLVGGNIITTTLTDAINKRMDSSDAVLMNEVDSRLYIDFHKINQPKDVIIGEDSFQYRTENELVNIINNGEYIEMNIKYEDGSQWTDKIRGNIKVDEVDVVNIDGNIKVDLENTSSRIFSITYNFYEDFNGGRVTLNRDFTRYLALHAER